MKKILALVLALTMVFTLCSTAMAVYTDAELEAFGLGGYTPNEVANDKISREIALDSYVLLENNGVLPIEKGGKVALFGSGATGTVKGGTGSGIVNQRERDWIDEALEDAGYTITTPEAYRKAVGRGVVATGFSGSRMANDVALTDEWLKESMAADTAIYVIGRNAGEGSDRRLDSGDGAFELKPVELENIKKVAANFENVIMIYNTQITDVSWMKEVDNIDALLHIGYGGQRTGATTVQVLTGEVSPSGKTTSTWVYDINDYPSSQAGFSWMDGNTTTEYYNDGIYVGYRYFDTFGKVDEVAYPFGFGLSYTEFDFDVVDVAIDGEEVVVSVDVANVGNTYSGKEVVQVYFSAPDGELEKPYQELATFAKTDVLAPGEKQTLTLTFATTDMSSYSEARAAYIMDAGEYIIRVGNSSRNTQVAAVATLDELTITEQLSNQLALEEGANLEEISKEGVAPITYAGEAAEIAAAPRFELTNLPFENNASPYDDETITTYLFAEEAENYEAKDSITIRTKAVAGIIENNPAHMNSGKGYMETTYAEKVEVVPALPEGMTAETVKLTDVVEGKITLKQFVASLTEWELARLAQGAGGTKGVGYIYDEEGNVVASSHALPGNVGRTTEQLFATRHIPVLGYCDGPAGIRCDQDGVVSPRIDDNNRVGGTYFWSTDGGVTNCSENTPGAVKYYFFPTAFPSSSNLACTWNTDLMYAFGYGLGAEQAENFVGAWLAPGMNIVRHPLCGRNFEYYSEDPYVTGIAAANVTAGVQTHKGGGVTIKHYWGNNQENNRNSENNVIGERAAREIYLKGYEMAIKLAQPMFMMTCYNENNGWPGGDSYDSCTDLARGEWGFKGLIMTDWNGGQSSPHVSMHAGNDMITPGKAVSTIENYIGVKAPEFNEDGTVKVTVSGSGWWQSRTEHWGTFVVDANGTETVSAPVANYDAVADSVKTAIAEGKARFCQTEDGYFVTWNGVNNAIVRGDVQKSALNILGAFLYSQDMQILCEDLGVDYANSPYAEKYSVAHNAPLANDWTNVEKSEITNVAIVADTVVADNAAADTAAVEISYVGDEAITSARIDINSELEVVEIVSDYAIENNDGYVVVYAADGSEIEGVLCTVTYKTVDADGAWLANGEYAVELEVVDATNAAEEQIILKGIDGAVIIDNSYAAGDANLDGTVSNADLIAIARYLVDLVEFDAEQLDAADVDDNGVVNNVDLIKVARALVA